MSVHERDGCVRLSVAFLCAGAMLGGALFPAPSARAQAAVAGFTPGGFRVNETGGATYSVPIKVPPGISGMEPKLAISYSSQAGNGVVGVGAGLSGLSAIHRCGRTIAQDGVNGGVSFDWNDRYCLDGQRLVAIAGSYAGDGTEYRTERESFTRIISYGAAGNGPAWFKVWTKSGQIMEYGNSADSRIEAQGSASVRVYALNKISDSTGNYLTVTYAEDNANGDYYPVRIDYTGNAAVAQGPANSVRFTYQPRSDTPPTYVAGTVIRTMNRLTSVKSYVGETVVRDYRLAYDNGGYASATRLTAITECSGDGVACFNPNNLSWQPSVGVVGFSPQGGWTDVNSDTRAVIADVNGDGWGDYVYSTTSWFSCGDSVCSSSSIFVKYSTGSGFSAPVPVWGAPSGCDNDAVGGCRSWYGIYAVGDVNGDGYADIVMGSGRVFLSTGGGFSDAGFWVEGFASSHFQFLKDVNGDGLADLLYGVGTTIYVRYSTGIGFSAPSYLATDSSGCAVAVEYGCVSFFAIFTAGDLNGDGRADIVTGGGHVYLSTGGGFAYGGNWGVTFNGGRVEDANGDGIGDLIYYQNTVDIKVAYSNGGGFSGSGIAAQDSSGCNGVIDEWWNCIGTRFPIFTVGDLNADGLADIYKGSLVAATVPTPTLVTGITDGLGRATSIAYAALSNPGVYAMEGGSSWPVRDLKPQVQLYLAASVSQANGIGGNSIASYFYRGGKVHSKGGGFLGFREVDTTDSQTGVKTAATFRQDYPFQGLPASLAKTQPSGAVLNQITNSWSDGLYSNGTGKYHRSDLTQVVESSNDLNGVALPTVTSMTSYDVYGNATSISVGTGDGYSKSTANTYVNDTTNWFLGRLTRSTVTSATP